MVIAFVFLNSEIGYDPQVEASLKETAEIKEVFSLYGIYDYIVKLEMESIDELKNIISEKIRRIKNIRSSLTLIVVE